METGVRQKPTFHKCRTLRHGERGIIYNVIQYFKNEKEAGKILFSLSDINARASQATGVSLSTIKRIERKGQDFSTPRKKKRASRAVWDSFDAHVARRTVHEFYKRRELPTLRAIRKELVKKSNYNGSLSSLRRRLVKIGFVYRRRQKKSAYLKESVEISAWRAKYLREIRSERRENPDKEVIYLDETWVNEGYSKEFGWEDTVTLKNPRMSTKGKLIPGTIPTTLGLGHRLMLVQIGRAHV